MFYACSGDSFEFNNRSVFLPNVVEKSQQTGRKTLWFTEKALGHCQSNEVKVCIENSSKAQDKGAKWNFFFFYFEVSLVVILNANETSDWEWPSLVEQQQLAYGFKSD